MQTVKMLRQRQLIIAWRNTAVTNKVRNLRNKEIYENFEMNKRRQVLNSWQKAAIETRIQKLGKMLADRMRVYRLRWCVFAGWWACHRNGCKVKRKALARVAPML